MSLLQSYSIEMRLQRGLAIAFAERRNSRRFPVALGLSFRVIGDRTGLGRGSGTTVNLGGKGLLFASPNIFDIGTHIELAVDWPVRLDGKTCLRLVVQGRIVRSSAGLAAVRIRRYEFRTRIAPSHS